jgi:hypothetical protein
MLQDDEIIDVKFECCWRKGALSLAEIKGSPTHAFVCPTCGARVRYSPYDLAQLIGKDAEDGPFEITFHRFFPDR